MIGKAVAWGALFYDVLRDAVRHIDGELRHDVFGLLPTPAAGNTRLNGEHDIHDLIARLLLESNIGVLVHSEDLGSVGERERVDVRVVLRDVRLLASFEDLVRARLGERMS